jgi:hypothetical protein
MKYVSPKYEISELEACDIIMSNEKYEVQNNNDGSGNVIMNAVDLFR